jgi:hypothetical protein
MQHVDISPVRRSSLTLRGKTRVRLRQAAKTLQSKGIMFSEQRLLRECLRIALRLWRGHAGIARRCRRYNKSKGPYEIMAFYTTEALRSVACARCHHSGISLSRLVDFSITVYLQRVIEEWLSFPRGKLSAEEALPWAERYRQRRHISGFVISYESETEYNNGRLLHFSEKSEILPWPPPEPPPLNLKPG